MQRWLAGFAAAIVGLGLSPARSQDEALERTVVELFCAAAKAGDRTAVEYLLTKSLLSVIRDAQKKNAAMQAAKPDEKPPLGDGVPYQSYQDVPPVCGPGDGIVEGQMLIMPVNYIFPETTSANWTDRLVLKWEDDLLRVDDVQYGPDFGVTLRKSLGEAFPQ